MRPAGPTCEPVGEAWALFDRLTTDRPITVVACAPLTNVAQYGAGQGVERIVLVGGELVGEGEADFNVGHDPSAAAAVLDAQVPTTVYPVDLFETVLVPPGLVHRLQEAPAAAARLAGQLLGVRRGHVLGDAGAVVFLTHPELFEVTRMRMAVVDRRLVRVGPAQPGSVVEVVRAADVASVVTTFVDAVVGSR